MLGNFSALVPAATAMTASATTSAANVKECAFLPVRRSKKLGHFSVCLVPWRRERQTNPPQWQRQNETAPTVPLWLMRCKQTVYDRRGSVSGSFGSKSFLLASITFVMNCHFVA